jgi:hypothetical protein
MRTVLLLLLPGLALLLLAAHFFHAGIEPLAAVAILLAGLLFVPRPWAARTLQAVLAAGTIEWLLTAYALAQMRLQHGQPWLRLALILGGVAVFTAIAAAVFQHRALRARFGLGGAGAATESSTA